MLINCPKCGFSQPKDRYCASCGVDIENYRPTPPPVGSKLLSNPILHVAGIFLIVAGAVVFIQQQKKTEIRERVQYLQGGPVVVQRNSVNTVEDAAPGSAVAANAESEEAASSTTSEMAAAGAAPTATPSNDAALFKAAATRGFQAPPSTNEVRVATISTYFVEMDRALVAQWVADSQRTGQFVAFGDDVAWGPIPDIAQKIARLTGATIHHKIEDPMEARTREANWIAGVQEGTPMAAGLAGLLEFTEFTPNNVRGTLEVRRTLPEGEAGKVTMGSRSFPVQFDLTARAGFMMIGVMPHRLPADSLRGVRLENIFKIYNSKRFENNETDFVILVQFDAAPAPNQEPAN